MHLGWGRVRLRVRAGNRVRVRATMHLLRVEEELDHLVDSDLRHHILGRARARVRGRVRVRVRVRGRGRGRG